MISIRNIKKSYGDYTVIKNLSIDIRKGEIIGLLEIEWSWKRQHLYRFIYSLQYSRCTINYVYKI